MASRSGAGARPSDWMTLAEASALLGVSPATLRRWADAGRVSVFTTPGGHRRFSRRGLRRLLPSSSLRHPAAERLGLTPDRLSRIYRRRGHTFALQTPWIADLDEHERERFRVRGRRLAVHLLAWLDAEMGGGADPEVADHPLHEASQAAAEYGRESADRGWSLSQTVEGFLQFRSPFMSELMRGARRRGLDASSATAMVESAEGAMDRLLLATMTGHSVAQVGRLSGRRRASGIEGAVD